MPSLNSYIREAVRQVPQVRPLLSPRARWATYQPSEYKTYDYMLNAIERLVQGVYTNTIGGDFIDVMANVISGQLTQAYQQAWEDAGETSYLLPEYLQVSVDNMILQQYDYVDQYFRDIVDARIDNTPIAPLMMRAELWAQRYTEAYNEATRLIAVENGGNLVWTLGATEQHCPECAGLNGLVAWASEWETAGVKPQNAPNDLLTCGGWRCDCSLSPTEQRRSPKALTSIMDIITGSKL